MPCTSCLCLRCEVNSLSISAGACEPELLLGLQTSERFRKVPLGRAAGDGGTRPRDRAAEALKMLQRSGQRGRGVNRVCAVRCAGSRLQNGDSGPSSDSSPRVLRVTSFQSCWCPGIVVEIAGSCSCFGMLDGRLCTAHCYMACNLSRKINISLGRQPQGYRPLFRHRAKNRIVSLTLKSLANIL